MRGPHRRLYCVCRHRNGIIDPGEGCEMEWTGGIDAITLFVDDLEISKAFYRTAFDLPVMFEDEASAVFNFESSVVNLLKTSAVPELIEPAQMTPSDAGS